MGYEDSELWITYKQNSRGDRPATTQIIELEFQSHKLNDLEDVLDHVVAQGWVESHYRSVAWWEMHDGTKLKNGERVETLLKQGIGKCEASSLRLVIADCTSVLWISYVFSKCPNAHTSVQRINILDTAGDHCGKLERLAHVTNFVFRKGFLPANVRSLVHWEDGCKRRIEDHACVKDIVCERGVGCVEDKPLRLVIGLDSSVSAAWIMLEADSVFPKTIPLPPIPIARIPPAQIAPAPPTPPMVNLAVLLIVSTSIPLTPKPPTAIAPATPTFPMAINPAVTPVTVKQHTAIPPIINLVAPAPVESFRVVEDKDEKSWTVFLECALELSLESYAIPSFGPHQTFSLKFSPTSCYTPSSQSSSFPSKPPSSAAVGRSSYHYKLVGAFLLISWTIVFYPCIHCVCNHCRIQ